MVISQCESQYKLERTSRLTKCEVVGKGGVLVCKA